MKPAPPKAVSYGCRPACHTYHWIHAPHEHRTLTQDEVDIHLPSCRATLSVSHALYPGIQAVPPKIHKTVKQSAGTLHCHCSVPKKEVHGWQARNSQVSAQSCNTGTAAPSCTGVSPTSPQAKVQAYCPTACYHHHLTTNQLTTQATLQLRSQQSCGPTSPVHVAGCREQLTRQVRSPPTNCMAGITTLTSGATSPTQLYFLPDRDQSGCMKSGLR